MAFFKKRDKGFLDLTERYKKEQEKAAELKANTDSSSDNANAFGFLGNMAGAGSTNATESYPILGQDAEKKRELSKKLLNLTEKIEDLSNQIYHLQQRIEVLERKAGVGGY